MIRTTAEDVIQLMNSNLGESTVSVFINTANIMVTDILGSSSLTAVVLEEIEKWLAAHLIAFTLERTTRKETLGEAAVEYAGVFGAGLDATPYGQMVKVLDNTGSFALAGKRKVKILAIES